MRNSSWALGATIGTLGICFLAQAGATEVLNLSAAAGTPTTQPGYSCYSAVAGSVTAIEPNAACEVYIPLPVASGHLVKQIAIVHDNSGLYPDPHIEAYLDLRPMAPPYMYDDKFDWVSDTPVPGNETATSKIMAQAGKLFPDAFIVDSTTIYAIVVRLSHGATVDGVQITYD